MANLLPALEGLNQLLMKQVEKKEKDTKKVVGAQLVSEYDKKLQTAKTSEEVSKINSWFLTETQKRDVPEVQQTGYYMLNNYLPKFQKEEEKAEKIALNRQDVESYIGVWKNIPVMYNGIETTGDVIARDLMKRNSTISSDEIDKTLESLKINEETFAGIDPTSRKIITRTERSSKAGGRFADKITNMSWNGNKIFIDNDGKIMGKDNVEILSTLGKYDEGVDTLIDSSEILKHKGGQQVLNAIYEMDQPVPIRGGSRGGYGGSGGKAPKSFEDKYFKGLTPSKSIKDLEGSLMKIYSNIENTYINQVKKEFEAGDISFSGSTEKEIELKIKEEATKRMKADQDKQGGNSVIEDYNSQLNDLDVETDFGKAIKLYDIAVGALKEGSALYFKKPREQFDDPEFKKGKDAKGNLTLQVRYPNLEGRRDKWIEVTDVALKNSILAYYNGE